MRKMVAIYYWLSTLPLVIMFSAYFAPRGSDPKGYGPAFAIGIISFLISTVLTLCGLMLCVIARKSDIKIVPIAVATVVSFVPVGLLVFAIATGQA